MSTKFIVMLKRRQGMSAEAFRQHYENNHVALGATFIGHLLVEFSRHYPGTMGSFAGDDWQTGRMSGADAGCSYDVISIYRFRDNAALTEMTQILSDPTVQRALVEDENRFLDRAACRMGLCDVVEGVGMVAPGS